jgi:phospholipid-binding lipoprotein MlaA
MDPFHRSLTNMRRLSFPGLLLIVLAGLGGCASAPKRPYPPSDNDPLQSVNRVTYRFNDAVDRAVFKPVAKGYKKYTPSPVRRSVGNFFDNISSPVVIVNDLLQGKVVDALSDTGRFVVNSTVGVLGIFDPATQFGLDKHDEDFGQTLGKWGVPPGPYLVIPFLGPSDLRDAPARYVDAQMNPLYQYEKDRTRIAAQAIYIVDTRANLLDAEDFLTNAFDPYVTLREAYLQRRRYLIYDGNPPPQYPEEDFEDEPDDSTAPPGKR